MDTKSIDEIIGMSYLTDLIEGGVAYKDFKELLKASAGETDIKWLCAKFYMLGKIYGKRTERAKKH